MVTPPKYVKEVLKTLNQREYQAFLVGGCVRDMLMDRQPHDWDIATSATPEIVSKLFPKTIPTGIKHGTVTVVTPKGHVEVTTFRSEGAYEKHRRPESVLFISSLKEDLSRRDFTMNAIALPARGLIVDPFGGRDDILEKKIRCVGDPKARFLEDALRMFRAFRFSAKLGFEVEDETLRGILACAPFAKMLAAERVREEIEKILLSPNPQMVGLTIDYGLMRKYLKSDAPAPEMSGLTRVPAHKFQRWAGLCGILEKSGHIVSSLDFLKALRMDNKTINAVAIGVSIVKQQMPEDKYGWKLLLWRFGVQTVTCAAAAADAAYDSDCLKRLKAVLKTGECFSLKRLAIKGGDLIALGYEPGVQVGKVLEALLRHVIEVPSDNRKEILVVHATRLYQKALARK